MAALYTYRIVPVEIEQVGPGFRLMLQRYASEEGHTTEFAHVFLESEHEAMECLGQFWSTGGHAMVYAAAQLRDPNDPGQPWAVTPR